MKRRVVALLGVALAALIVLPVPHFVNITEKNSGPSIEGPLAPFPGTANEPAPPFPPRPRQRIEVRA